MTGDQWTKVVEYVADRFPDQQWHAEQALAYFYDLEGEQFDDVWAGLIQIYEAGTRFAPNGSQLIAASRKQRHLSAVQARYALPETIDEAPSDTGFAEWTTARFGEAMTGLALIERIHGESKPCGTKSCNIHYPTTGGTE
jgi:hypothetical protein